MDDASAIGRPKGRVFLQAPHEQTSKGMCDNYSIPLTSNYDACRKKSGNNLKKNTISMGIKASIKTHSKDACLPANKVGTRSPEGEVR